MPEIVDVVGYEGLTALIGGPLQLVPVMEDLVAYIHEEGKSLYTENAYATQLCEVLEVGLMSGDFIAGPMLICSCLSESGENDGADYALTDEQVLRIQTALGIDFAYGRG